MMHSTACHTAAGPRPSPRFRGRPRAAFVALALLSGATIPAAEALAQGNDSASVSSAPSEGRSSAAPVGVLTTSAVTTGNSGPKPAPQPRTEGLDRRARVLGPVCEGLQPPARNDCRAKSGL